MLEKLLSLATGGATSIGGKVAELAAYATLIASCTPLVVAIYRDRNEVLFSLTVGQGCGMFLLGVFVVVIVKLAHRAPAP